MGIWLNDGTYEPMLGDESEEFRTIIRDRLGTEAEEFFVQCALDNEDDLYELRDRVDELELECDDLSLQLSSAGLKLRDILKALKDNLDGRLSRIQLMAIYSELEELKNRL